MKTAQFGIVTAIALLVAIPLAAQEKQAKKKGPAVKISPIAQAMLRLGKLHTAVEALDLFAEQEEGLKKVREETGPKMKEAFDKLKEILSDEQMKAAGEAAKKAKEAEKTDRQVVVAAEAAAKLTDEQKEKSEKVGKEFLAVQREISRKVMGLLTKEQKEKVKKAMMPKPRPKKEVAKGGRKKAE